MKRLGLILLILPTIAAADVVAPIDAVENNVNIRKSPDPKSEIVGRLDKGRWLTLIESVPGWHAVELDDGGTGFISADWTAVLDEAPAVADGDDQREARAVADEAIADASDGSGQSDDTDAAAADPGPVDEDEDDADGAAAVAAIDQEGADEQDTSAGETTPKREQSLSVADNIVGAEPEEVGVAAAADVTPPEAVADVAETADEVPAAARTPEPDTAAIDSEAVPDPVPEVESAGPPVQASAAAAGDEGGITPQTSPADTPPSPPVATAAGTSAPPEPPAPAQDAGPTNVEGTVDFLVKFTAPTIGGTSQIFDDGNFVGIGTTDPKQRLEVNGNIQINEQNSSVAGLLITQSGGETGYIMHNRASKLTIGAGSVDRITIDRAGNVGFGVDRPENPIELPSGAHVTRGGVWTNSSSRKRKENIHALSADEAMTTLDGLEPVRFNYRNDRSERYVGFIAEDVPDLVATSDREGLSAMDIVAVLTRVVQEQQKKIEALEAKLDQR
jgi:hypothetical protein